jgi:hypothetical protein
MVNIRAILGIASVGLMLYTMYEQNNTITRQKIQITEVKVQNDSLTKANDTLYSNWWTLKTYVDIKEGKAEE